MYTNKKVNFYINLREKYAQEFKCIGVDKVEIDYDISSVVAQQVSLHCALYVE